MRPRHASMAKQEEQEVNKVKPTEMATLSFSLPLSVSSHTVGKSAPVFLFFSLKRFFCPSKHTLSLLSSVLLSFLCLSSVFRQHLERWREREWRSRELQPLWRGSRKSGRERKRGREGGRDTDRQGGGE